MRTHVLRERMPKPQLIHVIVVIPVVQLALWIKIIVLLVMVCYIISPIYVMLLVQLVTISRQMIVWLVMMSAPNVIALHPTVVLVQLVAHMNLFLMVVHVLMRIHVQMDTTHKSPLMFANPATPAVQLAPWIRIIVLLAMAYCTTFLMCAMLLAQQDITNQQMIVLHVMTNVQNVIVLLLTVVLVQQAGHMSHSSMGVRVWIKTHVQQEHMLKHQHMCARHAILVVQHVRRIKIIVQDV